MDGWMDYYGIPSSGLGMHFVRLKPECAKHLQAVYHFFSIVSNLEWNGNHQWHLSNHLRPPRVIKQQWCWSTDLNTLILRHSTSQNSEGICLCFQPFIRRTLSIFFWCCGMFGLMASGFQTFFCSLFYWRGEGTVLTSHHISRWLWLLNGPDRDFELAAPSLKTAAPFSRASNKTHALRLRSRSAAVECKWDDLRHFGGN